ncbi:MAG: hypothetical protein JJU11_17495 [Candidatus Sumerlaeia bacterium]|nr:hypothetical protein [Candidatus Sumerlaeia bacterium]
MSMTRITFVYAGFLCILGVGAYLLTRTSLTALIPAYFSVPFFILGGLATLGEKWRKHTMHVAALLAVIMILMLASMLVRRGLAFNVAGVSQLTMLLGTMAYLAASVNSFISARKRRLAEK